MYILYYKVEQTNLEIDRITAQTDVYNATESVGYIKRFFLRPIGLIESQSVSWLAENISFVELFAVLQKKLQKKLVGSCYVILFSFSSHM